MVVYERDHGRQRCGVFRELRPQQVGSPSFIGKSLQPLERDLDLESGLLLLSGSSRL